jgi:hypothetical protein
VASLVTSTLTAIPMSTTTIISNIISMAITIIASVN